MAKHRKEDSMSHHGEYPLSKDFQKEADARQDLLRKVFQSEHLRDALGPTGKHPEGKLVPHDEGGLTFAVGVKIGKVTIEFGSPVKWFGMDPSQARQLADLLLARADQAQIIQPNSEDLNRQINELVQKIE